MKTDSRIDSVLQTILDVDGRHVRLYKHSGYGNDIILDLAKNVDFFWDDDHSTKYDPNTRKTRSPKELDTMTKTKKRDRPPKESDTMTKTKKKDDLRYWVGGVYNDEDVSSTHLCFFCLKLAFVLTTVIETQRDR
jgi:hypothetical protein